MNPVSWRERIQRNVFNNAVYHHWSANHTGHGPAKLPRKLLCPHRCYMRNKRCGEKTTKQCVWEPLTQTDDCDQKEPQKKFWCSNHEKLSLWTTDSVATNTRGRLCFHNSPERSKLNRQIVCWHDSTIEQYSIQYTCKCIPIRFSTPR